MKIIVERTDDLFTIVKHLHELGTGENKFIFNSCNNFVNLKILPNQNLPVH